MALQRASRGIPLGQSKRRVLAEGPMKEKGSGGSDGAIQLATDNAPPHGTRKKETDVEVGGGPSMRKSKSRRSKGGGVCLSYLRF